MSDSDLRLESDSDNDKGKKSQRKDNEVRSLVDLKETKEKGEKKTTEHVQELLKLWKHYTIILPIEDTTVRNIAAELCALLLKTKSLDALAVFLEALPDTPDYNVNESIIRAKIYVSLNKKDTVTVYKLIKDNRFSNGEDLIKAWDDAGYIDEERRTKKKLTPLSKFRVRKRHPPPKSIGVRKTNTLPRDATSYLKTWLMNHVNDPYPSSTEKQHLSEMSGLSQAQVKTWFANARRRSKNSDEFQRRCDIFKETATTPYSVGAVKSSSSSSSSASYEEEASNHQYDLEQHPVSHLVPTTHYTSTPAFYEYVHPFTNGLVDRSGGYIRYDCGGEAYETTSTYGSCNTVRLHREQPICQYDAATRILIDLPSKGGFHHYDYTYGAYYH